MILKGLNYWSFPGGFDGAVSATDAIDLAKSFGYEALEFCVADSGPVHLGLTESEAYAIRDHAQANGIALSSVCSGLYWERSLANPDAAVRAQAADDLTRSLRIAGWLGATTLLTIPGLVDLYTGVEPTWDYEEVFARATEGVRAAIPVAAESGVAMAIENVWNKFILSPLEMRAFVDSFDSPWVGAYVDVANMLAYGYPQQWLRILGPRVRGVHFKDFRRSVNTLEGFVDLLEGDVDWPAVMSAIRDINYTGAVVAEMVPYYKHYPMVRVANTSRAMDAILGRI